MKSAILIYNPNSGKKRQRHIKAVADFEKIRSIFKKYNYEVFFYKTKYAGHANKIVSEIEKVDLVVSLGGDGTFNEVITGNMKRKEKLVLSHIPFGTTNDIGTMFGMGKNVYRNLELILTGVMKQIDIGMINDRPFMYVAGFGKFLNIAYDTNQNLKKKIGYMAYIIEGARDLLFRQTPLYELTYEVDGEIYSGLYSFALISNANQVAGIKNFHKNVKLDDGEFEVILCNLRKKPDIIKTLFYLRNNNISNVPGFYFHKTSHIKFTFIDRLRKPWCLDGEKYNTTTKIYDIKNVTGISMLVPEKIVDKLFIK